MRNGLMTLFVGVAGLLVLCNGSCDGGGSMCKPYVVPAGTDLMNPAVSFKNDVLPIFQNSCAFSACHATMGGANNGVYLGELNKAPTNSTTVVTGLMKASQWLPSMQFVTPGNPSQSFLMHKMDADQCTFDKMCTNMTCQASMPQGSEILPLATRDTVRRWIAQGAKDN